MALYEKFNPLIFSIYLFGVLVFGIQDKAMADTLEQTKTWCVGRYLIDLPTNLEPQKGSGSIETVQIESLGKGDQDVLSDIFKQRRTALLAGIPNPDGAVPQLVETPPQANDFSLLWKSSFPNLNFTSEDLTEETYILADHEMFRVTGFIEATSIDQDRASVARIAKAVQPLASDHTYQDTGVCLPNAFVAVPVGNESADMLFADPDIGPFALNVAIVLRAPDAPALPDQQPFDDPSAIQVNVANLDGQTQKGSNTKVQEYLLRASGTLTPSGVTADLRLRLTDQRAVEGHTMMDAARFDATWQQILSSIRLRK